jgi:hypothetical protein
MKCNRCGTQNPSGSENCFNCGCDLAHAQTIPSQAKSRALPSEKMQGKLLDYLEIGGTPLIISDRDIRFDNQTMQSSDVTGIRYGVYKQYVNGIRTSRSYEIWLTDGRSSMCIECASFMASSSTVESRYREVLQALHKPVIVGLLQSLLMNLESGSAFQVGDVIFDESGMHRPQGRGSIERGIVGAWAALAGRLSAEQRDERYKFLPWSDYLGHSFGDGNIYIRRHPNDHWATLPLRDTWNAVCLGPFFNFLQESGSLRSLIAAESH